MSVVVRFTDNDRYGAWTKGETADDLGLESPGLPIRMLRLHHSGELLTLTNPYERGLIERVEEEPWRPGDECVVGGRTTRIIALTSYGTEELAWVEGIGHEIARSSMKRPTAIGSD